MSTVHLLTWNLNERDAALEVFAKHVARRSTKGEPFIAAVQECTEDAQAIAAKVRDHGATTIHAVGNGSMSVLCSEPLEAPRTPRDTVGQRLVLTRTSVAGQRIAIVNYHGKAQGLPGSPDATERGGITSEARWRIDDHAASDPVIILGDFNAEPTDSEVESAHCFSFASNPNNASRRSHDRDRQDLRVAPLKCPTGGTYYLRSPSRGSRWRTLDFFAGSPSLAVQSEVLISLDGAGLIHEARPTMSDHLPVAGTMELP